MGITIADFPMYCRCCINCVGEMKPLFSASLVEMLTKVVPLKFDKGDEYPQQICTRCILKLSSAFNFTEMVQNSHNTFTELLKGQITPNDILNTNEDNEEWIEQIGEIEEVIETEAACNMKKEIEINEFVHELNRPPNKMEYLQDDDEISSEEQEINTSKTNLVSTIKCPHCPTKFLNLADMKDHITTHNEPCKVCNKIIPKRVMARHLKIHDAVKPYKCDICERRFADSSNLNKHYQNHNRKSKDAGSEKKTHLCPHCGKSFKWRTSLARHLRYHTGDNLHTCTYCSKSFSTYSYLRTHLLIHEGNSDHVCQECGLTFTQASSLNKHRRKRHDGLKLDECSDKLILDEGSTTENLIVFKCNNCDDKFATQGQLQRHAANCILSSESRTLTMQTQTLKCNICQSEFADATLLMQHYSDSHKVLSVKKIGDSIYKIYECAS